MPEVINVRFRGKGKAYYFDPAGNVPRVGDDVIVATAKGPELGQCVRAAHFVEDTAVVPPLRAVLRLATEEDQRIARKNREKEEQAFELCQKKIEARGLDMKLVDVEYSFDGSKILFFFTSDGRVDFRELVKDLAGVFRTRIELRQIGVRDSAKLVGGLGICGRPFCCTSFLENFQPVSIKMAKTQSLSLNPAKISGTCGRLMCCLKYEQEAYEHLIKNTPKVDAPVDTPDGKGNVTEVNLLRRRVKVKLADQTVNDVRQYPLRELGYTIGGVYKEPEPPELPPEEPEEERLPFGGFHGSVSPAPGLSNPTAEEGEEEKGEHGRNRRRSRRHKGKSGQHTAEAAPADNKGGKSEKPKQDKPAEKAGQDKPRQEQRSRQKQEKPAQGGHGQKAEQPHAQKAEQSGEQKRSRNRNRPRRDGHGKKPEGAQPPMDEKARARADAVAEAVAAAGGQQKKAHRPRRRNHRGSGDGAPPAQEG